MLYDNHGRIINYLRLAVTDRCNLRCFYCMPEEGIKYIDRKELMTFEEMQQIIEILYPLGINKLRITGGEPFLRKDLLTFLTNIKKDKDLKIHITSNGTLLRSKLDQLKELGITDINLSLDTLDRERFKKITRRDELEEVEACLYEMLEKEFNVKINMVVMKGQNEEDLIPMANLTKNLPIDVRFLEEMPFNGGETDTVDSFINHIDIFEALKKSFPSMRQAIKEANATSQNYEIDGHIGRLGIIASYSRTFCGTCNRIRLTPQGLLKTCLYDSGIFNIKKMIRNHASNEEIKIALLSAIGNRAKDGNEAEQKRSQFTPLTESMATIGG